MKLKEQLIRVHSDVKNECPDSRQFQWNERLQNIVDTKYNKAKEYE